MKKELFFVTKIRATGRRLHQRWIRFLAFLTSTWNILKENYVAEERNRKHASVSRNRTSTNLNEEFGRVVFLVILEVELEAPASKLMKTSLNLSFENWVQFIKYLISQAHQQVRPLDSFNAHVCAKRSDFQLSGNEWKRQNTFYPEFLEPES